jgi:nucleotide sugar dehydrogenase
VGISIKILIVGHGFVGKAVDYGFTHPKVTKTIVDPKYGTNINNDNILDYDLVFVCVPTPMGSDGNINTSIIDKVIGQVKKAKLVVVKSTVTPDIVERWPMNVVYNPEFLTEKSANEQFVDPPFHILGGDRWATERVEKFFTRHSLCNPCPVYHMTRQEASFVKYAINSFLAMKVTFFNQLYDAVNDTDANYNNIIKAIGMDPRIGHSHTKVPGFDSKQGFGGACFPKDTSALTNYSKRFTLIEECVRINNEYRNQYELDERERQQNVNYGQTQEELEDQNDGSTISV